MHFWALLHFQHAYLMRLESFDLAGVDTCVDSYQEVLIGPVMIDSFDEPMSRSRWSLFPKGD